MGAANTVSENNITGIKVLKKINPRKKKLEKRPKSWEKKKVQRKVVYNVICTCIIFRVSFLKYNAKRNAN